MSFFSSPYRFIHQLPFVSFLRHSVTNASFIWLDCPMSRCRSFTARDETTKNLRSFFPVHVVAQLFQGGFHEALELRMPSIGVPREIAGCIHINFEIRRKITNVPRNIARIFVLPLQIWSACGTNCLLYSEPLNVAIGWEFLGIRNLY